MTQDDKWNRHYDEVMGFMLSTGHRPSKHRLEEHAMLNWFKHNKKQLAAGSLPPDRAERFRALVRVAEGCRRLNQYQ